MIGTGIFTSLGFQVVELKTGFAILFLWFLGGISALIGAMAYSELGAFMPRSGGEYHFLSKIYHPALGFLSGWVSFIIGFAAPTAAASMALGAYFSAAVDAPANIWILPFKQTLAITIILLLSWIHSRYKKGGAGLQIYLTGFKIMVLLAFIFIGLFAKSGHPMDYSLSGTALREIVSPAFAIAIFFVSFAYSGWNAAAYIAGELKNPARSIPLSLLIGTAIVTLLYILITYVFLKMIPAGTMEGKIEIGYLFGQEVFGPEAGRIMGTLFSLLLFSTVSSLIITGPRVSQVMGEDYPGIRWFSRTSKFDTPLRAIYIQAGIAILYVLTATFEQMITYIGFTLNLMTLLTVLGMMINRHRHGGTDFFPFRVKPYPLLPVIFLVINTWILVYGLLFRPLESCAGIFTTAAGLLFWIKFKPSSRKTN